MPTYKMIIININDSIMLSEYLGNARIKFKIFLAYIWFHLNCGGWSNA